MLSSGTPPPQVGPSHPSGSRGQASGSSFGSVHGLPSISPELLEVVPLDEVELDVTPEDEVVVGGHVMGFEPELPEEEVEDEEEEEDVLHCP